MKETRQKAVQFCKIWKCVASRRQWAEVNGVNDRGVTSVTLWLWLVGLTTQPCHLPHALSQLLPPILLLGLWIVSSTLNVNSILFKMMWSYMDWIESHLKHQIYFVVKFGVDYEPYETVSVFPILAMIGLFLYRIDNMCTECKIKYHSQKEVVFLFYSEQDLYIWGKHYVSVNCDVFSSFVVFCLLPTCICMFIAQLNVQRKSHDCASVKVINFYQLQLHVHQWHMYSIEFLCFCVVRISAMAPALCQLVCGVIWGNTRHRRLAVFARRYLHAHCIRSCLLC